MGMGRSRQGSRTIISHKVGVWLSTPTEPVLCCYDGNGQRGRTGRLGRLTQPAAIEVIEGK